MRLCVLIILLGVASCALNVASWGQNYYGQLGRNVGVMNTLPSPDLLVGDLQSDYVVSAALSSTMSAFLTAQGKVYTTGQNYYSNLCQNIMSNTYVLVPTLIDYASDPVFAASTIKSIVGTYQALYLITDDGRAYVCGSVIEQTGGGPQAGTYYTATLMQDYNSVLTGKIITDIAGNYGTTQAFTIIVASGKMYSKGQNSKGQLGRGNKVDDYAIAPVVDGYGVIGPGNITKVSCGQLFCTALSSNGTVFSWGDNASYKLGGGTATDKSYPDVLLNTGGVITGKSFVELSTGFAHTIIISSDGKGYGFGSGSDGRLCNGAAAGNAYPYAFSSFFNDIFLVKAQAGYAHTLVLSSNGTVYACGNADKAALGNGATTGIFYTPVQITPFNTTNATVTGFAREFAWNNANSDTGMVILDPSSFTSAPTPTPIPTTVAPTTTDAPTTTPEPTTTETPTTTLAPTTTTSAPTTIAPTTSTATPTTTPPPTNTVALTTTSTPTTTLAPTTTTNTPTLTAVPETTTSTPTTTIAPTMSTTATPTPTSAPNTTVAPTTTTVPPTTSLSPTTTVTQTTTAAPTNTTDPTTTSTPTTTAAPSTTATPTTTTAPTNTIKGLFTSIVTGNATLVPAPSVNNSVVLYKTINVETTLPILFFNNVTIPKDATLVQIVLTFVVTNIPSPVRIVVIVSDEEGNQAGNITVMANSPGSVNADLSSVITDILRLYPQTYTLRAIRGNILKVSAGIITENVAVNLDSQVSGTLMFDNTPTTLAPATTTSPTTTARPVSNLQTSLNAGQIVGIAVGSAVAAALLVVIIIAGFALVIFIAIKRKRKMHIQTQLQFEAHADKAI